MPKLIPVDVAVCALDIHRDLTVEPRKRKPGPNGDHYLLEDDAG